MEAVNTIYPPNNTNPMAPRSTETATRRSNTTAPYTDTTTSSQQQAAASAASSEAPLVQNQHPAATAHTNSTETHTAHTSKLGEIKETLRDIKESVKDTFGRDHPRGGDGQPKRAQDGKTNPME